MLGLGIGVGMHGHITPVQYLQSNLLLHTEPLLANLSAKSGTVTQASFSENGLSNGIQFPAAAQQDYAYLGYTYTANTIYTGSIYVVMGDASAPVYGLIAGTDLSVIMGATMSLIRTTVVKITGNLYRVTAISNSGATPNTNANFGVIRQVACSGKAFRITGYQLTIGAGESCYRKVA